MELFYFLLELFLHKHCKENVMSTNQVVVFRAIVIELISLFSTLTNFELFSRRYTVGSSPIAYGILLANLLLVSGDGMVVYSAFKALIWSLLHQNSAKAQIYGFHLTPPNGSTLAKSGHQERSLLKCLIGIL